MNAAKENYIPLSNYNLLEFQIGTEGDAPSVLWQEAVEAAFRISKLLSCLNLKSFFKSAGNKNLRVVIPIEKRSTWNEVIKFASELVLALQEAYPSLKISTTSKPTAYQGQGGWKELKQSTHSHHFKIKNALTKISRIKIDPWEKFHRLNQALPPMK